jgi:hypothetical protein
MTTALRKLEDRISERHEALFRVSETLISGRDPKELLRLVAASTRVSYSFTKRCEAVVSSNRELRTSDVHGTCRRKGRLHR